MSAVQSANVLDVVRDAKFELKVSEWKAGHIPRFAFPLSKSRPKSYKFGQDYQWRTVSFETSKGRFLVLILLNVSRSIYRATLAQVMEDDDLVVLCQHEYHQSEPGWHCHVTSSPSSLLPRGVVRKQLTRWPKYRHVQSEVEFKVTLVNALSIAADRFKFSAQGGSI